MSRNNKWTYLDTVEQGLADRPGERPTSLPFWTDTSAVIRAVCYSWRKRTAILRQAMYLSRTKIICGLLLTAAGAICTPSHAQVTFLWSGSGMAEYCSVVGKVLQNTHEVRQEASCLGYILGAVEAQNLTDSLRLRGPMFCLPDSGAINSIAIAVTEYFQALPEEQAADLSAASLLQVAMPKQFLCPQYQ